MAGSTEQLKKQTGIEKKPLTIRELLEVMKPQIALALPRHLTAERMVRVALTAIKSNPQLAKCDSQSIIASVMLASQLGWEIGVQGQAYLVPYSTKRGMVCQLIPGWKGLLDLVNRAGAAVCRTEVVYRGDEFWYQLGTDPKIHHRRTEDSTEEVTHVYAVGHVRNSPIPIFDVWPMAKVRKHLGRYNRVGNAHYALQSEQNMEMYARKVALLQVMKYLPQSIELRTALAVDDSVETGQQKLTIEGVRNVIGGEIEFSPTEEVRESKPDSDSALAESIPRESESPDKQAATEAFELLGWSADKRKDAYVRHGGRWDLIRAEAEELLSAPE
jgi:recombination protein RecT